MSDHQGRQAAVNMAPLLTCQCGLKSVTDLLCDRYRANLEVKLIKPNQTLASLEGDLSISVLTIHVRLNGQVDISQLTNIKIKRLRNRLHL